MRGATNERPCWIAPGADGRPRLTRDGRSLVVPQNLELVWVVLHFANAICSNSVVYCFEEQGRIFESLSPNLGVAFHEESVGGVCFVTHRLPLHVREGHGISIPMMLRPS